MMIRYLTRQINKLIALLSLLILLLVACEKKPPYGRIYHPLDYENFSHLIPINDSCFVFAGVWAHPERRKTVSLYKYLDADFATVWEHSYEGESFDMGYRIIAAEDKYLLLGLTMFDGERDADSRVVLVDSAGSEIWNKNIGDKGSDRLFQAILTRDSGYLLVGSTARDTSRGIDGWLVKLNQDGDLLWQKSFGKSGSVKGDYFSSIQATQFGGYIISGYTASYGAGRVDGWLVKINEEGKQLWAHTYGGLEKDYIQQFYPHEDGGFIIAGTSRAPDNNQNRGWLFRIDSLGNQLWNRYFNEISGIKSMAPLPSGGYLLLASIKVEGDDETDIWLAEVDERGEKVWTRELGGSESDSGLFLYRTSEGFKLIASTKSYGNIQDSWIINLDSQGLPL